MKNLTTLILIILLAHTINIVKAQDPTFSQFFANKSYLNPAFVGIQKGFAYNVSQRSQWLKMPRPYNTTSASFEVSPCYLPVAYGLSFYKDREGEGLYITRGFSGTYSYMFVVNKDFNIHTGMRTSYTNKRINWLALHFSDEIDPVYGFTTASSAIPTYDVINVLDFDFGIVIRNQFKSQFKKTKIKTATGISINHAFRPNQSLYVGNDTYIPKRLTIHSSAQIPFASAPKFNYKRLEFNKFWVVPHFKMEIQSSDTTALLESYSWGAYIQTPMSVYGGFFFQHSKLFYRGIEGGMNAPSLIFLAGFEIPTETTTLHIGMSYDMQPSGLSSNISGGTLEVSIRFIIHEANLVCNPEARSRRWNRKFGRGVMDCNKFF